MPKCFLLCLLPFFGNFLKKSDLDSQKVLIVSKTHSNKNSLTLENIRKSNQDACASSTDLSEVEREWVEHKVRDWFNLIPKTGFDTLEKPEQNIACSNFSEQLPDPFYTPLAEKA